VAGYLPLDTGDSTHHNFAKQASARSTFPGGMEGWVDLGVDYTSILFTRPSKI